MIALSHQIKRKKSSIFCVNETFMSFNGKINYKISKLYYIP